MTGPLPYGSIPRIGITDTVQGKVLTKEFFSGDVKEIAPMLLGKSLCVRRGIGKTLKVLITETEAYDGELDLACHASKGKTLRTSTMYEEGGICYVYLCYGIHWMLNVVTGPMGYPAAVLIRGCEEYSGPGRLTKNLGITGEMNGVNLAKNSGIWIEDTGRGTPDILSGPRIGIDYAGPIWSKKPFRFWFSNS